MCVYEKYVFYIRTLYRVRTLRTLFGFATDYTTTIFLDGSTWSADMKLIP